MTTVLSIGNFDGVHRGHDALIREARRQAGAAGRVVALTFEPHPSRILQPGAPWNRLATSTQRRRWLLEAGADDVIELETTRQLLAVPPEDFIRELVGRFQPLAIVEGEDFRFGRRREGDVQLLSRLGQSLGFGTIIVPAVEVVLGDLSVVRVSSSLAKWLISQGRVTDAAILLGRPYELEAAVERGDQRGRTIGVPTANLSLNDQLLPADGVYSGWAERAGGGRWPAAVSVGTKPTFGEHRRVCEAHLIDYHGPIDDYGWTIRLAIVEWLRGQIRYDRIETLIEQLHRDIAAASRESALGKQSA